MTPVKLIGVYNADGGLVGELRYIVGHLLGTTECALCDITHSPIRRKPEWDAMVAGLGIELEVAHRNEVSAALAQRLSATVLPAVFAQLDNGEYQELLSAAVLATCEGSVEAFRALVAAALEAR